MLRQPSIWCPTQVQYLSNTFSYHALVYLAELKRDVAEWIDHSRCAQEERCVAYNIDDKTFRGRHVENCSGCLYAEAPLEEMMSILDQGEIPILKCDRRPDSPGKSLLSFARLSNSTRYTAVSHLWSDGLGIPSLNCLPRCQLERLVDLAQAAVTIGQRLQYAWHQFRNGKGYSSTLIWLDVYCVPASTIRTTTMRQSERLKAAAISRMVPTFALAQHTLVLDRELQNFTSTDTKNLFNAMKEDFLARLIVSGWRSRCWTHQEAQVSQRILIKCHGSTAIFDYGLPWIPWPETRLANEFQSVANEVFAKSIHGFRNSPISTLLYSNTSEIVPKLHTVWSSFYGKTTSQPGDALGCFANIMRLSAAQISSMPAGSQM